jgi:hypothetical protein
MVGVQEQICRENRLKTLRDKQNQPCQTVANIHIWQYFIDTSIT